jgi:hypothetical protein
MESNILSIGQLDEVDYNNDIDTGVMKIREPNVLLLAKVKREVNRLYLLTRIFRFCMEKYKQDTNNIQIQLRASKIV